jgi:hypothetical protein
MLNSEWRHRNLLAQILIIKWGPRDYTNLFFKDSKTGQIKIRYHADGNVKNFLAFQQIENMTHINKESQRGYIHWT